MTDEENGLVWYGGIGLYEKRSERWRIKEKEKKKKKKKIVYKQQ